MRKLFLLFVALLATTALRAYDFKSGDLYYKITSTSKPYTVEVVYQEYSSSENYYGLTTVVIPDTITYDGNTYSVTSIGQSAFEQCSSLTSVIIGDSVKSIDLGAFGMCQNLTSLVIGNSVTSIIQCAFYHCTSLTNVIIPNSVTEIDWGAFWECSGLTHLTIGKNVTFINQKAFADCCNLTSITLLAEAPPTCSNDAWDGTFENVSSSTPIYVPCGCVDAYKNADGWNSFYNIQELLSGYNLEVYTKISDMGVAQVDKNSVCGAQISATANYGYHFTQWNDGVTDNPRLFVITQDTTFTAEFAPNQYTITTVSADEEMGYTEGDTVANYLEYITLSAIANYGYHFVEWSDYTYENPRVVQVTEDMTYTAIFEKNLYNISLQSNNGTIESVTQAAYLDNVTMMAVADYGYHFTRWSDGVKDNPRTFVITQDTAFTAEFAQTYSGQCGDNLYWGYANDTLTITGTGAMYDARPWGLFVNEIHKIVLPTGITHIGKDAFQDCIGLRDIDLPYTLETIGDYSFNGCRRLITINCYPILPPIAESTSFSNYSANLYAPCDNLDEYKYDMVFGQFKYFECMGSESVTTDGTIVTPGSTDVTITWPTDENADTYTILIMKGEEIFCRLLFNKDGQLLNIAFAPGRNGQNRALYAAQTANGLRFTVTGLEEQTHYGYDVSAKDEENNTISSYTGEFTTQGNITSDLSDIQHSTSDIQKLIRDGQLLILRDGKTYNVMGAEIQ